MKMFPSTIHVVLLCLLLCVKCTDSVGLDIQIPRFDMIKNLKERLDLHQSASYLLMPHIYRAFIYAGASPVFLANQKVSNPCKTSLSQYYTALIGKKTWAWKMYDSTGKQSAGVFTGATTWTGSYDECLNSVEEHCPGTGKLDCGDPKQPQPQYCSVHMTHAPWMPKLIASIKLPFPVPMSPFIVDVCVPYSCSSDDVLNVVKAFLLEDNNGDNITVKHVYCHHEMDIVDDVPALISVLTLLVVLSLVIIGTSYDIYRRRHKVRVKRGPEITIGYTGDTDNYGILKIVVPTRKQRRRRATLSSSEYIDQAARKESLRENSTGTEHPPRHHSKSESSVATEKDHSKSHLLGTASEYTELENIPEDIEMIDALPPSETVGDGQVGLPVPPVVTNSLIKSPDVVLETPDTTAAIHSDDDASMLSDARDNSPIQQHHYDSLNSSAELAPRINRHSSFIAIRPSHRSKKLAPTNNIITDLLMSFSFRKNTRHILAEGSADTLYSLNGVRVLSIGWIVLGNVYGSMYQNLDVVDNDVGAVRLTQSWWMQMVINTTLAADSFFVLSGTLIAYNFLKIKTRAGRHQVKSWREVMSLREYGFMIVHRLFRIFPCYAVLLMLATNLMPYLGRGPRWSHEIESVKTCKKNWWANALFINNFYNADNMCQPHTYYLACDFQFFLVAPLVLIPLLIKPKLGLGFVGFFVIGQIAVVSALNQGINGNVLRMKVNDYWNMIYVKPYSRIGVYCIGLALGYFLFHCDRQMKFRKIPLYSGWIVSCVIIFLMTYITFIENREGGKQWTGLETALYEAFSRPLWALALSWVIFACTTGQAAFVGKFLSWNLFLPLCRITYGVFLLHPVLISVVIESSYHNLYLNMGSLVYMYIALFVCSYGLAFVLISCVEAPFTTFESHIRLRFKAWNKDRKLKKIQKM